MADTWTESVFNIVADFVDGGNREGLPAGKSGSYRHSDDDDESSSDDDDD